jgi:hypothetical protein
MVTSWKVMDFPMMSPEFFIDIILPATLWPWVDSAYNINEYQEYLLGDKGSQCVGLTLPPSCADFLEIWEPQPPRTLWACNGNAFCFNFKMKF